ncbi:type II toxin-antitoxin system RelE/ParE family toxin [Frigoriflavimonas asaccharolytica]|uniref:Plasmid stabilization system protein ParE n=1 Tax=Frigoriflavimonas asaccharolytica TaxID=2735899 RepID=A0A8J8G7Z6_9FLAO|nr:type II toxin-antitoxin system RelE/ParE family toxin [Frigoriflavimonas asaccharolytica]NRS91617.1 plasmid stabilization system protein ParE [Frigoriflavimonas asaccharolytica]
MRVQYTDQSLEDLKEIEYYLLQKWNVEIFENFIDKFYHIVELILEENVIFQKFEDTKYRKILITKHNTLIYKVENEVLFIIKILQNFQNPAENLKYFDEIE